MRELVLTGKHGLGKFALVDDDLFTELSKYKWHCHNLDGTVLRNKTVNGKVTIIYLHREVFGQTSLQVDHIDCNRLNNQRSNLRAATNQQNNWNKPPRSKSGYKGVLKRPHRKSWYALIAKGNERYYLGRFKTAEEAAIAYNEKAKELFGEFAWLNQV